MSDQEKPESKVYFIGKADKSQLLTTGSETYPEDSFQGMYWTGLEAQSVAIIEPQYKPGDLHALVVQNNTLLQCVEAMEVNIDGTGHTVQLLEGEKEDKVEEKKLSDFFHEPYPGKSMIDIRRQIRRDRETCGNGYLEVIRNIKQEVVMLNAVKATEMRLLRMDGQVTATKLLMRGGKEIPVAIRTRERRFVQVINNTRIYFKEFGASRDLDRHTGLWAKEGEKLKIEDQASEIIHICGASEPKTPYGIPRWINQIPSALGSRKAEEFNYDYFDSGGITPVLIIVQGGTLGTEVRETLEKHLSGKGNKHRAAVVEAVSTSGSLDAPGNVQVKVERFGGDNLKDALFLGYDKNCSDHIRGAFRLPPLFLGLSADTNFATAYTSYMIAEAQVFFPERDAFDTLINTKIVKSFGVKKYEFRSLPMSLADIQNQIKALEMVTESKTVKGEDIVKTLNEITGLSLEYTEPPEPPEQLQQPGMDMGGPTPKTPGSEPLEKPKGADKGSVKKPQLQVVKSDFSNEFADISGLGDICDCANHLMES